MKRDINKVLLMRFSTTTKLENVTTKYANFVETINDLIETKLDSGEGVLFIGNFIDITLDIKEINDILVSKQMECIEYKLLKRFAIFAKLEYNLNVFVDERVNFTNEMTIRLEY